MKNIKAVILAGGLGTRLRPITCTRPKPMCMLLDETVIERIILKLSECGIQKAAISTMYLSDKLCNQLGKCVRGVDLLYVNEETPKGSAGGAKLCATELGIENDDIFVILSGDGVFDFSLTEAIKSHVKRGAEVTIVTSPTKNPLEYGVILSKEDGRIYSFTEKPGWSAVKSDSVNTGIYIINGSLFKYIPNDRPFDFSKDLFPHLLGIGAMLYSCELNGYWRDMGSISDYFSCCADALSGRIKGVKFNDAMTLEEMKDAEFNYTLPCYISKSAEISKGSTIGAYSVIGKNTKIKDSRISASIIFENCTVIESSVDNSIICENTFIEKNVTVSRGCIIGAGCTVKSGAILTEEVSIWPNKTISGGFCVTQDVLFENKTNNLYTDEGYFAGNVHGCVNSEQLTKLGRSIALAAEKNIHQKGLLRSSKIGVMHDGSPASSLICEAILCGIKSAGAQSFCFMKGYEMLAKYAAYLYNFDYVAFITESGDERVVKLFDGLYQTVTRDFERSVESFFREAYTGGESKIYETKYIDNTNLIYIGNLIRSIETDFGNGVDGSPLKGIKCFIPDYTHDSIVLKNLKSSLCDLGATITDSEEYESITVSITESGTEAYLRQSNPDGNECCLDTYHISACLVSHRYKNGRNTLFLPYSMTTIYGKYLNAHSSNRERQSENKYDKNVTRQIIQNSLELTDMSYAVIELLAIVKKEGISLQELQNSLPPFEIRIKNMTNDDTNGENRASVMKRLHNKYGKHGGISENDGVRIAFDDGNVTVIPRRTGGFKLISESVNAECAMELCDTVYDEIIKLGNSQ